MLKGDPGTQKTCVLCEEWSWDFGLLSLASPGLEERAGNLNVYAQSLYFSLLATHQKHSSTCCRLDSLRFQAGKADEPVQHSAVGLALRLVFFSSQAAAFWGCSAITQVPGFSWLTDSVRSRNLESSS